MKKCKLSLAPISSIEESAESSATSGLLSSSVSLKPSEAAIEWITCAELFNILTAGSLMILDVREGSSFSKAHLPRSINIELLDAVVQQCLQSKAGQLEKRDSSIIRDRKGSVAIDVSGKKYAMNDIDTVYSSREILTEIESKLPMKDRLAFRRRRMMEVVVVSEKGSGEVYDPAWAFASILTNCRSIRVLQDGVDGFMRRFPFVQESKLIPWYPTIVIEDFLYLGCEADARLLKHLDDLRITHILNLSAEVGNLYPNRFEYLHVDVPDMSTTRLDKYFSETITFIEKVRSENNRILVHCYQGVSRSATIVLAFLMKHKNWTLEAAYSFLKKLRPIVQPNPGFWAQLQEYENRMKSEQCEHVSDTNIEDEISQSQSMKTRPSHSMDAGELSFKHYYSEGNQKIENMSSSDAFETGETKDSRCAERKRKSSEYLDL